MRKKSRRAEAKKRIIAKAGREKEKIRRDAKAKTPGQKLHELMHAKKGA